MEEEGSRVLQVRAVLLAELRSGSRRPGSAINVKEVAERLRVSATPVREALERLAGERLVSVTGDRHGFAVLRLRPKELVGYNDLLCLMCENAARARVERFEPTRAEVWDAPDPAVSIEAVLGRILIGAANPILVREARRLSNMIAPFRRHEPPLIESWKDELARIANAERPDQAVAALRAFTRTRRLIATDIVDAAER